ncbi:MAG: Lrp/AsnC ligand binding domain-containing protein [Bacteroidia bacterium]|nr:Lrp/AsnC ligand binding domain-containing protein [Bacteroidia bacterium]MDW8158161.1 Lrp/AsnC ligand binding domain-containing protein [Bacteroidia bacterium]
MNHKTEVRKVEHAYELDDLDKQILQILLKDASIPYTEIAKGLSVSGGTIHVRMRKMQEAGIILGSRLIIDPSLLGFDILAFIGIYLEKGSDYKKASEALLNIPEIIEMHYTTGLYNIFAKVICRDTTHLRNVLNNKIQVIPGVQRTETFISLEQSIDREIKLYVE